MTSRPLAQPRADALATMLDLDLDAGICHACLSFVSPALDEGDPVEIARQIRRTTPDLWDEGLAEPALAAVRRACEFRVPDAEAALADLERHLAGVRSHARSFGGWPRNFPAGLARRCASRRLLVTGSGPRRRSSTETEPRRTAPSGAHHRGGRIRGGSGVPSSLQRLGARIVIESLPASDYRIQGGALVERKTVADLHGSLARGRLWSQVGRVRDAAVLPFLFVEGDDLDDGPRHPNAIRGCLLAIADLGIAVVRTRDPDDTALWLHRLAIGQQRRSSGLRPAERRFRPPPGVTALTGIPGISEATARALIDRFGTIEQLLAAGPERWADVDGVGPVRAHALAMALLG